jgi:hypothetical protein
VAVRLNRRSFEHAQRLIQDRRCVLDHEDDWSGHRPSRHAEKLLIEQHGIVEYRKWHLGEDEELEERSRSRYKFAYGDFRNVHRCAVLAAESGAGQHQYLEIELAAAHLHGMLDAVMAAGDRARRLVGGG